MNQEIFTLRREAAELPSILLNGTLLRHGEVWAALPRETVSGPQGVESIVFEVIRPESLSKPSWLKAWFKAIRPESLAITLIPCLAVLVYGCFNSWPRSWGVGIASLLGVLFLQIAVNLLNDVEDHLRLIDLPGTPRGSGVIQRGWLNARELRIFGYLAFGVGLLCGLPAAIENPRVLLWIGGVAALGVISYSNRPWGMKYRVVGDLGFFLLVGPLLTVGFSQATFRLFDSSVIWLGLCFGFAACGISHARNLQDIEADSQNRIKTLASQLGFKVSRHILLTFYGLSYLSLLLGVALGGVPGEVLGTGVISFLWVFRVLSKAYQASGPVSALLSSVRADAARAHLAVGLCVCCGLLLRLIF